MGAVNPKTKVYCDYFGKLDYIYFNFERIAELEEMLDKSLLSYINGQITVKFLSTAYMIGLKHCHHVGVDYYLEKFDELATEKGIGIDQLAEPIVKALLKSGFFGKKVAEKIDDTAVEEEEKNA